jgi:hypothetical protein
MVGKQQVIESYGTLSEKIWPLPYVPPQYVLTETDPAGFDDRHKLPNKFLFYPAQFWAHKNHIRLLEALATVRNTCPDIKLACMPVSKAL